MAQGSVTVVPGKSAGRRFWHISFAETSATSTSEWTISAATWSSYDLPRCGVITHYNAVLVSGTGTTLQPIVRRATAAASTSIDYLGQVTAAAQHVNDASGIYFSGVTALFGASTPNNAAADHSITTEMTIFEGH